MNLVKFHKELSEFLRSVRGRDKSPYNDGYKDALMYVLDWIEEYM